MLLAQRNLGGLDGTPTIIVHGLLGSSRNWVTAGKAMLAAEASSGPVLALDLRNHGESDWAQTMSFDDMVGDVLDTLNDNGFTAVRLIGHSLGGKVLMRLACQFPERVAKLNVVDIAPKPYEPHYLDVFNGMESLDLTSLRTRGEADAELASFIADPALRSFALTNLVRGDEGYCWRVNLPVLRAHHEHFASNSLDETDLFDGPVRFIYGQNSDFVLPEDEDDIREHFPEAEMHGIAQAGHNVHVDNQKSFLAALTA